MFIKAHRHCCHSRARPVVQPRVLLAVTGRETEAWEAWRETEAWDSYRETEAWDGTGEMEARDA